MDVRALKDEAAGYFGKGRFSKAAALYAKLAQAEPDNAQHLMRQGDCLRHDGKKEKAIELYEQAATFHSKGGALLKAIAAYKMILEINPAHEPTRLKLEALSKQRLSTRSIAPVYVPRAKAQAEAAAMEFEDNGPSPAPESASEPEPAEANLELPPVVEPPVAVREPDPGPLELDLDPAPHEARIEPVNPSPEPVQALELDLEPSTPDAPVMVRATPLPIEPIEIGLPPAEATAPPLPASSALPFIEIDPPEPEEPTSVFSTAAARTDAETDILARAEVIAQRDETPLGHVMAESIRDDLVDPSEIGLVALPPEEELNPDDVVQGSLPLFSELPHEAFVEILHESILRRIQPDEIIISEGEVGQSFFVLIRGSAKVVKRRREGEVELARLEEGAFFGEVALLSGEPRMASVIATEECDLLEVRQTLLRQLANAYPGVSRSIVHFYKERLLANVLSLSSLFRALDPADRPALLKKFVLRDVAPDTAILKEGQKAEGLYVVMSGAALVTKAEGADQLRPLALLREGDVFGEMSLLTRRSVSATVTAKGPTILLMLPKREFDEVIQTYPVVLEAVSDLNDLRASLNEKALSDTDVTRAGSVPRV